MIEVFLRQRYPKMVTLGPMENLMVITDPSSETLFSCHTDTVHWKGGRQSIMYDPSIEMIYVNPNKNNTDCLGADDGAGIWIMMQMLDANIPGTYIFHRGEERGGIGSRWIRDQQAAFLRRYKRAVAFDRRDTTHILTHQGGTRCCSNAFAEDLALSINAWGEYLEYAPDDTGVFTDTKNYTALIPECTNISVGYFDQHSHREMLDVDHIQRLVVALIEINWEHLVTEREAKVEPYRYGGYGHLGSYPDYDDTDDYSGFGNYKSYVRDYRSEAQKERDTLATVNNKTADELAAISLDIMRMEPEDLVCVEPELLELWVKSDSAGVVDKLNELVELIFAQQDEIATLTAGAPAQPEGDLPCE